jgi:hypothetical protein
LEQGQRWHGLDIIVLDDPKKPDEALSETHRNSAGQRFDTTLLTGGRIPAGNLDGFVIDRLRALGQVGSQAVARLPRQFTIKLACQTGR